ncbi:MAG: hypothetical protein ACM3TN_20380 [Alphaproteobacteria bacterium]
MPRVTLELPGEVFSALRHSPEEFARDAEIQEWPQRRIETSRKVDAVSQNYNQEQWRSSGLSRS